MYGLLMRHTWPLALMRYADRVPIKSTRLMRLDPSGFSRSSVQPILHYIPFTSPNSLTPFLVVHGNHNFGTVRCRWVGAVHCIKSDENAIVPARPDLGYKRK